MVTLPRFANVTWHLAGADVRYQTVSVPLTADPANDRTRIREYLARRYLRVAEAAPLVALDQVEEYETNT